MVTRSGKQQLVKELENSCWISGDSARGEEAFGLTYWNA
jgi:hypothetical protein